AILGIHYAGYHQKALGVREARADLVCQIDDDNRVNANYLERLADTIEAEALDFAICWIKTDYQGVPELRPKPPFPRSTAEGFAVLCLMIRRALVAGLGGWPEHGGKIEPVGRHGDDDTLIRIAVERGRYRILEEALGYHRRLR